MLGLVLPLVLDPDTSKPGVRTLVRSCGPLDSILDEFGLSGVTVVPKAKWTQLKDGRSHRIQDPLGYDTPELYDTDVFTRFRQLVLNRFHLEKSPSKTGVLIIDRGNSPAFYQSDAVDNPTSANLRRSVPNMTAIYDALLARKTKCVMKQLEIASLRDQVGMFQQSTTLVAQHGAGLVNMIWMNPGGSIIEILPEMGKFVAHFKQLAATCGHTYVLVRQETRHAPVDVDAVLSLIP